MVVNVEAVNGVAVASRARVDADSLALLPGEPREGEVVQLDEAVEELTEKAAGDALHGARGSYESGSVFTLDFERAPGGVLTGQDPEGHGPGTY